MMSSFARPLAAAAAVLTLTATTAQAQTGVGAHLTPYAGYLVTGNWYDGPVGTSIATTNASMIGAQGAIPLTKGVSCGSDAALRGHATV